MAGHIKKSSPRVPEGFTLSMAVMDCFPVFFFCVSACCLAARFPGALFRIGIFCIILAGSLKVSWKMVIALAKKNIPFLGRQMRFLMPAGFALCILSLAIRKNDWSIRAVWQHITSLPSLPFFLIGIAGMCLVVRFARKGRQMDAKANWKEQAVNAAAQFCIMMGILLA